MRISALTILSNTVNNYSLTNPFQIKGLYPKTNTQIESLPFKVPNPSLLDNLPYLFNTIAKWDEQTQYQQINNSLSSWHILVDDCIVNELIIPVSTAKFTILEGPIHIKTITLDNPLSFDSNLLTLNITKYIEDNKVERMTYEFPFAFISRAYSGITDPVIETYIAVVKDILLAQSDKEINIKGYSIKYVSDILYINNQAYEQPDLPVIAWLMYVMFN